MTCPAVAINNSINSLKSATVAVTKGDNGNSNNATQSEKNSGQSTAQENQTGVNSSEKIWWS